MTADISRASGLAIPRPAMSGAEPCTASKTAPWSPMFAPGTTPRPPTRPAPGRQGRLDTRVEALGVLADDDQVHVPVTGGRSVEVADRPHRRVEVQLLAEAHVDGDEALADRRGARPLQRHLEARDRVQGLPRQAVLTTLEGGEARAALHPLDRGARRVQDAAGRQRDLRAG